MFLGDSLTAGYGLDLEQSVPSLVQKHLDAEGYTYEVVNAGVSGDTSAGGLRRLEWSLDGDVRILVIELGANDGLRGLPVADMKQNLKTIIGKAKERGIDVLLTGMEAPPNYGPAYTSDFRRAFRDLAGEEHVAFMSFYLDGVAGIPEPEHRRRHASQPGGRAHRRSQPVAGAQADARQAGSMIELRGVSKTVMSGGRPLTILHPLDLTIASGQFLAVLGPSGSGKSTLLGLVAGPRCADHRRNPHRRRGHHEAERGRAGEAARREDRLRVPVLSPRAVAHRVREHPRCRWRSPGGATPPARARQLLGEVGLADRGHHYPSQLSGGEQQRVAIARALANDPPIILADEPTGNLDSTTGRLIMELLLDVRRTRQTTMMLVTHDADLASLADSRLVLRDGRPVEPSMETTR